MFTVTWAVLVSLSGLCLVVLEQAPLLLTIIGLLLLYGAAVAHDLHAVVSFRNAAAPKFLTSYGDELLKLQGALQYQKESELQEAKRRSFLSDLRTAKELESVSMLPTLKTPQDIDPESVFSAMIEILMKKVRADGVALVVPTGDAGEISVFQKGLAGKTLAGKLSYLYEWFFRDGNEEAVEGLINERATGKLVGDFLSSGISYSVRLRMPLDERDTPKTALVFIAFKSSVEPDETRLTLARNMVAKMGQEYRIGAEFVSLESKANAFEGASRAKSDFISHMSHDIRSPLNNIRSILNLFKYEGVAGEHQELLEVAFANCDSLSEIVEAILDYSKFSAGKLESNPEVFDLRKLIQSVLESFAVTAKLKGLEIKLRSDSYVNAPVKADKKQLRRVLSNLVSNAIKYTDHGFIEVGLKLKDELWWNVQVRDTGIGMSDEQLKALFAPFTRFQEAQTDGIGLGLTLSKILVDSNGGTIAVSSNQGVGSVFAITFPRFASDSESESLFNEPMPAAAEIISDSLVVLQPEEAKGSLRILLVDDDVDCVDTLARSLEIAGHQVFKSISVSNAISIYNFELPDVVITDLSMPNGGGRRVIDYVSSLAHESRLFVVSGSTAEVVPTAVDKVFQKPLEIDLLLEELALASEVGSRLVA